MRWETGVPIVCSIGTTDPWNAAGLGLDVRVLAAMGVRPVTIVAGVSAQSARGLSMLRALDPEAIVAQFRALEDATIAAYRVGALLDVSSVVTIAAQLQRRPTPAVYDPVLTASNGGAFAETTTQRAIVERLLPRISLATPNLAEVRTLAAMPDAGPLEAARSLIKRGAARILVTGIPEGDDIVDLLVDEREAVRFVAPRIAMEVRGTGCMLACGIAASLARGLALHDAIARARAFVRDRIADGEAVGEMRLMNLIS